jgi:hypothetical protein
VYAINAAGTLGSNQTLGCRQITVRSVPSIDPLASNASWLQTVNYYRTSSGLAPVTEEASWSDGILKHLRYLANTPSALMTGAYASAHTENPASPWYTAEGDTAGRSSNIGGGATERDAIEGWMAAPFHAIGILRPQLERSAFGSLNGAAGLDVVRGFNSASTASVTSPVVFPGPNTVVRTRIATNEFPNPLESCAGYQSPAGLPIVALLPRGWSTAGLSAELTVPSGATLGPADLCVVTAQTYRTTDAVYGPTGAAILTGDNAAVLIPRAPLTPGTHHVRISTADKTYAWSFQITNS